MITAYGMKIHRERYGGRFPEHKELLFRMEYASEEDIRNYQDSQLRLLISHAYESVPYYRRTFDKYGVKPGDIQCKEDLPKIPVLTRELLKDNFSDLISKALPHRILKHGHTSGTTGTPLEVYYDPGMISMTYAALDRQFRWAGVNFTYRGDRIAVIRGNVIVPLPQRKPPYWRYNWYDNQLMLSNFHLSPGNLPSYYEALRNFKTVALDGYPSSVYVLAKVLINRGERLPLKAVLTSSETLYDYQRETIEAAFLCKVFDYYGSAERVIYSAECDKHEGHHLFPEYGITEIQDTAGNTLGPGQEGVMVGTSLQNYGMPMIRYRTNDLSMVKMNDCSCGRSLPLVDDVTTKVEDLLRLKDGRLISPSVLTHPFKPLNAIDGSQIIQTDLDRLIIRIVPRVDYSEKDTEHLKRELKSRLGDDMRIDIEFIKALPRSKGGKFKWVVSEVELGI